MKPKITFTKDTTPLILEALKKSIDKNGYVIDAETKKFVKDAEGKKFKSNELVGIVEDKYYTSLHQIYHTLFPS